MNLSFLPVHPIFAHAFGQTYNLPVPLWLFLYGGAAVVIVSFVIVAFFIGHERAKTNYPERLLGTLSSKVIGAISILTFLGYSWVVVAGIIGSQSYLTNISPTLFWVLWLTAFTWLNLLVGNIWQFINPFKNLLIWLERLTKSELKPRFTYPEKLGYFPALAFYFGFVWLELLSNGYGIVPFNLSKILLGYGVITVIGALAYGKDTWFRYGDFFSVFFGLFGRISVIKYVGNKVYLRPPFVGLLDEDKQSVSLLLFVLFILSSTAFDGLRETAAYNSVFRVVSNETVILLAAPFVFLTVYWLFMWVIKQVVRTKYSVKELALKFSLTLVPIAVAYNIAHYFTLLLLQGQLVFKFISDPFGLGWNLFHTNGYTINAGVINAATVWYIQVSLIIVGHIAAVYLAHLESLKLFPSTKKALLSQYPMLALMVVYTMVSLWIIAQPIIAVK